MIYTIAGIVIAVFTSNKPYTENLQERLFIENTRKLRQDWYYENARLSPSHGSYETEVLYIVHPERKHQKYEIQIRSVYKICDYCYNDYEFWSIVPNDHLRKQYEIVLDEDEISLLVIKPELVELYKNRFFEHSYFSSEPLDNFYKYVKSRLR